VALTEFKSTYRWHATVPDKNVTDFIDMFPECPRVKIILGCSFSFYVVVKYFFAN